MRPLSRRERRIVAICLLIMLVVAIHALALDPIVRGFAAREEARKTLSLQLQRNTAMIASIEGLRRQVDLRRSQLTDFAVVAPSPADARAQLVQRLQAAIESAGGEVRESEPAQALAGWVGARVTARMTLSQAASVLARLQNDQPPATIEGLTIAADATQISAKPGAMEMSIEIAVPVFSATSR